MILDQLKGQERAASFLKSTIQNKQISHAYLFSGPDSIGKKFAATLFAAAINCKDGGCGTCDLCRAIVNGFPPVFNISPVGRNILISQIHEAKHWLEFKTGSDVRQVLIVDEIELMNVTASNALLKTLEEPPGNSCIIGITSKPDDLLPTVRSRVQVVPFTAITDNVAKEILAELSKESDLAEIAVKLFPGQISKPLMWVQNKSMFDWRANIIAVAVDILSDSQADPILMSERLFYPLKERIKFIDKSFKDEEERLINISGKKRFASSILKSLEENMKRKKDREEALFLKELLSVMTSFYRDALVHLINSKKTGRNDFGITNSDQMRNLIDLANNTETEKVIRALKIITEANKVVGYNLDEKFILENLFMQLRGVNKVCR